MVRSITNPGLRALILLLAVLGSQASSQTSTQVSESAIPGAAAQSSPAQPVACSEIPFDKPIDREMSRGEKHCFSFTVSAGQFVQAVVEQQEIDVAVAIFRQNGDRLTSVDRPNVTRGPETASLIAPGSGVYRLQIDSNGSASIRGRYRVALKGPRAAIPSDEKRIEAENLISEDVQLMRQNNADPLRRARGKF